MARNPTIQQDINFLEVLNPVFIQRFRKIWKRTGCGTGPRILSPKENKAVREAHALFRKSNLGWCFWNPLVRDATRAAGEG